MKQKEPGFSSILFLASMATYFQDICDINVILFDCISKRQRGLHVAVGGRNCLICQHNRNNSAFAVLASFCHSCLPHAGKASPGCCPPAHPMAGTQRIPQPPEAQCGPPHVVGVWQHGLSSPGPPAAPQAAQPMAV